MKTTIFNNLLLKLNNKMSQKRRKILLLVDQASVHAVLDETKRQLDCVQVEFLLAHTTPVLQPCDAGIIHSFKCHYKTLFVRNRISAYDDVQNGVKKEIVEYNVYDAINNVAEAWSMVSSNTIINC